MLRKMLTALCAAGAVLPGSTLAGFATSLQTYNVRVTRIFSGTGATYVEFTSLPSCNSNGGYLTASWPEAHGGPGPVSEDRAKQIVATLLYAKATETAMEVRYRLNDTPTGWDSCAIDAVFLH